MATIAEKAYSAIRERVLSGEYAAGDRLREGELAEAVGVSRTPVREALRRLDAEGLVEYVPNRGAHVAAWSQHDLEEIFGLRALLEGYGARLAASKIEAAELQELEALADQMESIVRRGIEGRYEQMALVNSRFHRLVVEAARNTRLAALVGSVVQLPLQQRTLREYSQRRLDRSMSQHRELIDALAAGDTKWAEAVMQAHVLGARHALDPAEDGAEDLSA